MIRHGETDFNRMGIVQGGGVDSDLNEQGRNQGKAFFEAWKHVPFDGVFSSGLKRTAQTLEPWQSLGYGVEAVPGLNELGWGRIEGQHPTNNVRRTFRRTLNQWKAGNETYAIEGGESPAEVWARAKPFFDSLPQRFPNGGKILVCTHGRTMRILLANLLGYGVHRMDEFLHTNTSLNVLRMYENGRYFAEVLNDQRHLAQLPAYPYAI
jgi:probable phosphoglycerate mutase